MSVGANIRKNDILSGAHEELELYEENLARIKREVSDFKINILSMYKEHIESLSKVPEIKREPANVVQEEIAEEPAEEVVETVVEETVEEVAAPQEFAEETVVTAEEETIVFESAEPAVENKFNNISSLFE